MKFWSSLAVVALLFYLYTSYGPLQDAVTDPYFCELRVKDPDSGVSLVGFGEMNSLADCETRSARFWAETLKFVGETEVSTTCKKDIPAKYQRVFANERISATYMALEKGQRGERNARLVFYGVPSSVVAQECPKLIERIRRSYKGKIYCVQGSVG